MNKFYVKKNKLTFYEEEIQDTYRIDYIGGFKQKEPAGKAYLSHIVANTPKANIKKMLEETQLLERKDFDTLKEFMQEYDFYSVALNLSITLNDPEKQRFVFGRFQIFLDEPAEILRFFPQSTGLKTIIKQTGERAVNISPYANFSPMVSFAKIGVSANYVKKKGWVVSYDKNIAEVVGVSLGNNGVGWDIYQDEEINPVETIKGKARSVPAFFAFYVKKLNDESRPLNAHISAEGKTKKSILKIDFKGDIKFIGDDYFALKPIKERKVK